MFKHVFSFPHPSRHSLLSFIAQGTKDVQRSIALLFWYPATYRRGFKLPTNRYGIRRYNGTKCQH